MTGPTNSAYSSGKLLSGSRIKFSPLSSCSGKSKATNGLYSYTMSSSQLTFTKQSDSCPARSTLLTGQAWSKQ